jgi:hypothetical protein
MPPSIQRMALLKIIARMIKTTPRVIKCSSPRLEVFVSIATLSAAAPAVTPLRLGHYGAIRLGHNRASGGAAAAIAIAGTIAHLQGKHSDGRWRARTADLLLVRQALSQLS